MPRLSVIDGIEGFYLTLILDWMHRAGVLRALTRGRGVASIARGLRVDRATLTGLLHYVALRSTLVDSVRSGGRTRFTTTASGRDRFSEHLLDQYVGGFGPCLLDLPAVLKRPRAGERLVDKKRHAAAYATGTPPQALVNLIEVLGFRTMLEVGCGAGQLLAALARRRRSFSGIGVDANPDMTTLARRRMAALGLTDRIKILHCELDGIGKRLGRRAKSVDGICAVSSANSFFRAGRDGVDRIDRFLDSLARRFPGRLLVLCDYYGRLGMERRQAERFKRTLVHDVAQLVSAQGIPPEDLTAWRKIYARNSARLLHASAALDAGVAWFIHVVRLGAPAGPATRSPPRHRRSRRAPAHRRPGRGRPAS